jgi:photosystem II stability/assembly factor-like uncharacterized protein
MTSTFTAADGVFSLACMPELQPDRSGICLAGCSSGLYRSHNSGLTWQNLYDRLSMRVQLPVTAVAFSPRFGEDHTMFAAVAGNVFRSEDSGEHWDGMYIATPLPSITCLALSPNYRRDTTVFVGTLDDGVFMSTDYGRVWQPVNFGLLDLHVLCLAVSPDYDRHPQLLAGTDSGLFRSNNGGRAWRDVPLPGGSEPVLSLAYSPDFIQDRRVFAGTENKGIFVSESAGRTWARLGGELSGSVDGVYPLPGGQLAALADTRLYAGDLAGNWQPWAAGDDVENISAAAVLPSNPPAAMVGCIGGEFKWIWRES